MTYILEQTYYYQDENTGKFLSGKAIRLSPKFITLENNGYSKRKSKQLVYKTEDEAKLNIIKKIDLSIREAYALNILELSNIFKEMLVKYPEKFV